MARLMLWPTALLALLSFLATAVAGWDVCNDFPYNDLLFLENYEPAEQWCSEHFPLPEVTITAGEEKRWWLPEPYRPAATGSPATSSSDVWASCTRQGGPFLSTLCSCIEHPKTVTVSQAGLQGFSVFPTPDKSLPNTGHFRSLLPQLTIRQLPRSGRLKQSQVIPQKPSTMVSLTLPLLLNQRSIIPRQRRVDLIIISRQALPRLISRRKSRLPLVTRQPQR